MLSWAALLVGTEVLAQPRELIDIDAADEHSVQTWMGAHPEHVSVADKNLRAIPADDERRAKYLHTDGYAVGSRADDGLSWWCAVVSDRLTTKECRGSAEFVASIGPLG